MDLFENMADVSIGLNFLLIRVICGVVFLLFLTAAIELLYACFRLYSKLRKRDRSTSFFSRKLIAVLLLYSFWSWTTTGRCLIGVVNWMEMEDIGLL